MKKTGILIIILLLSLVGFGQKNLNLGMGYYAQTIKYPGLVAKAEYEKFFSNDLSLPLSLNLGFSRHNDFNVLIVEMERGYRKYISDKRFYLEQAFGLGMMVSYYKDKIWTEFEGNSIRFIGDKPGMDIMPSVVLGGGLNVSKDSQNYLWIRSKISFPIPTRELSKPYMGFQIGYAHLIKSSK